MPNPDEPIRELILADIQTRLEAINGPTSTYWNTVNSVSRSMIGASRVDEAITLILFSPGDSLRERRTGGGVNAGIGEKRMMITVGAWIKAEIVSDTLGQRLLHDIEKAVLSDRSQGTYAMDSFYESASIVSQEATAPLAWIEARFVIQFRHQFDDPAVQV